jgi:hypothetical protein
MDRALKNSGLMENVAKIYNNALTTGRKITTLPPTAVDYFAAMRKSRFDP